MESRLQLLKQPDPDEIEVSLFGPGIGESILIHLGSGEWMVVDSCLDPRTRQPAALQYLETLGVDPKTAIKIIVITHWHNDHMLGISKILGAADLATIVCSGALQTREFAELVAAYDHDPLGEIELPEFAEILKILRRRKTDARAVSIGPTWAIEGRVLFQREQRADCAAAEVRALSPSDGAKTLAHLEFAQFLPKYRETKLAPVSISPNNVATVLWVEFGNVRLLLGSDLEESRHSTLGWQAILNSPVRPTKRAQVFKVPHHGSENAHCEAVWTNMVDISPIAMLTTFLKGSKPLPSETDVARIKTKTSDLFSTAQPGGWKPKKYDPSVERTLGRKLRSMTGNLGHVRIRRRSSNSVESSSIDLFSGATRL